jgi:hypothetical protein
MDSEIASKIIKTKLAEIVYDKKTHIVMLDAAGVTSYNLPAHWLLEGIEERITQHEMCLKLRNFHNAVPIPLSRLFLERFGDNILTG